MAGRPRRVHMPALRSMDPMTYAEERTFRNRYRRKGLH